MFIIFLAMINTETDTTDPLWQEMELQIQDRAVERWVVLKHQPTQQDMQHSEPSCLDSGIGSSWGCTPPLNARSAVFSERDEHNQSKESGEISVYTDEESLELDPDDDAAFRRSKWKFYVARSLAERMVLEQPPTIHLAVLRLPKCVGTLITDRVGVYLTTKDKTVFMRNNQAQDFW